MFLAMRSRVQQWVHGHNVNVDVPQLDEEVCLRRPDLTTTKRGHMNGSWVMVAVGDGDPTRRFAAICGDLLLLGDDWYTSTPVLALGGHQVLADGHTMTIPQRGSEPSVTLTFDEDVGDDRVIFENLLQVATAQPRPCKQLHSLRQAVADRSKHIKHLENSVQELLKTVRTTQMAKDSVEEAGALTKEENRQLLLDLHELITTRGHLEGELHEAALLAGAREAENLQLQESLDHFSKLGARILELGSGCENVDAEGVRKGMSPAEVTELESLVELWEVQKLEAVKGGAGQHGDPQDLKDRAESAERIQILEAQVKELNSQELLSRNRCEQAQGVAKAAEMRAAKLEQRVVELMEVEGKASEVLQRLEEADRVVQRNSQLDHASLLEVQNRERCKALDAQAKELTRKQAELKDAQKRSAGMDFLQAGQRSADMRERLAVMGRELCDARVRITEIEKEAESARRETAEAQRRTTDCEEVITKLKRLLSAAITSKENAEQQSNGVQLRLAETGKELHDARLKITEIETEAEGARKDAVEAQRRATDCEKVITKLKRLLSAATTSKDRIDSSEHPSARVNFAQFKTDCVAARASCAARALDHRLRSRELRRVPRPTGQTRSLFQSSGVAPDMSYDQCMKQVAVATKAAEERLQLQCHVLGQNVMRLEAKLLASKESA